MGGEGVWSPGYQPGGGASDHVTAERAHDSSAAGGGGGGAGEGSGSTSSLVTSPVVWAPANQQPSPLTERKEFRPVNPQLKKQNSVTQVCFDAFATCSPIE